MKTAVLGQGCAKEDLAGIGAYGLVGPGIQDFQGPGNEVWIAGLQIVRLNDAVFGKAPVHFRTEGLLFLCGWISLEDQPRSAGKPGVAKEEKACEFSQGEHKKDHPARALGPGIRKLQSKDVELEEEDDKAEQEEQAGQFHKAQEIGHGVPPSGSPGGDIFRNESLREWNREPFETETASSDRAPIVPKRA